MRKCQTFRLMILSLILTAFAAGCVPESKKVEMGPRTAVKPPPPLSVETVDKRIAYLRTKVEEQDLDREEKAVASDLLATYQTIRSYLQEQSLGYDETKIIQLLFENLGRLEQEYFLREKFEGPSYSKALSSFSEKRKKIVNAYLAGDYQGVINECVDLEATFGPDSLTPEIGLLFAVALAKKGMLSEAIIISEKIIHELEGKPDLIHLRASIIEWQLDLGNREKALKIYEKMMDDLDEREELLAKSKLMVMEERRKASRQEVPPAAFAGGLRQFAKLDSTHDLLKAVDELVQKHEFGEAKLLLIKHRIRTEEGPELEIIDQALRSVDLAEERYLLEKRAKVSYEKETLKLARKLIEEENFDEALAKIEALRESQNMTPEMVELKRVATEKLIKRERNRAAKYFLMARKTSDPAKKEELLMSSYDILKGLIERYPSSPMIGKLNDNLRTVREQLSKLGKDPES
ncbi:MAG: hypothetical protein PVI20_08110 [Desulfobacteraceae bacterium]